jgi:hypothetical protein
MMASVSTYGKASILGRERIITTLTAWHAEGLLDTDDWRGLQDFPVTGDVWAAQTVSVDVAEGVEPVPDSVTILLPRIDYETQQPLSPHRVSFMRCKPSFKEPHAD